MIVSDTDSEVYQSAMSVIMIVIKSHLVFKKNNNI